MPLSTNSLALLATCDPRLQQLFTVVSADYPCQVLQGARTKEQELANIAAGRSALKDPMHSKHVTDPVLRPLALAVDVAPSPVVWPVPGRSDYSHVLGRFYHFAGFVLGKAETLGLHVRWGGDWNGDLIFTDQTFDDLDHFELADSA